jgi:hypothetical protein
VTPEDVGVATSGSHLLEQFVDGADVSHCESAAVPPRRFAAADATDLSGRILSARGMPGPKLVKN